MIDFIIAGVLHIGITFVLFFCLSIFTIGITYAFASFVRRCVYWVRPAEIVLK